MVDISPAKYDKYAEEWRKMSRSGHQDYGTFNNYVVSRAIEEGKVRAEDVTKSTSDVRFSQAYSEVAGKGEINKPIVVNNKVVGHETSAFLGEQTAGVLSQAPTTYYPARYADTGKLVKPQNITEAQWQAMQAQEAQNENQRRQAIIDKFLREKALEQIDIFTGWSLTRAKNKDFPPSSIQQEKKLADEHPYYYRYWYKPQERFSKFIKSKTPEFSEWLVNKAEAPLQQPTFTTKEQFERAGMKMPFTYKALSYAYNIGLKKTEPIFKMGSTETIGIAKGYYDYSRNKPLNALAWFEFALISPYIFTGANVIAKGAFLRVAPYIPPTIRTGAIFTGKALDLGIKFALVYGYGRQVNQKIREAPTPFEKSEVLGETGFQLTELFAGSYLTRRYSTTYKKLAQTSLKQTAQIRLLPYSQHYTTNQLRIDLTDKLSGGRMPSENTETFNAKKIFPKLTYEQAGNLEYNLKSSWWNRKVIIGSTVVAQGKPADVAFYKAGTIDVKVANPKYITVDFPVSKYTTTKTEGKNIIFKFVDQSTIMTPKTLISSGDFVSMSGGMKTPKDIDIVTRWWNVEDVSYKIPKATGGKVTADVHSLFLDRTHPYSQPTIEATTSIKGYKVELITMGEQLGRGFEGVTNIYKPMENLKGLDKITYNLKAYFFEKGEFYRFAKDNPKFMTTAESLIKSGVTKTGAPLVTDKGAWLAKLDVLSGRDLTNFDYDIYKFKSIATVFPADTWATPKTIGSIPPAPIPPPQPYARPLTFLSPTPTNKYSLSSGAFSLSPALTKAGKSLSRSPSFKPFISPSRSISQSLSPPISPSISPSLSISPSPSLSLSISISPSLSISPSPPPPPPPPSRFQFFRGTTSKTSGLVIPLPKFKQPKKYTPTARALAFGLKGKTTKASIITGLGERFINFKTVRGLKI